MPLYEYTCQECGEQFEKLVRFSSTDQPIVCPNCRSTKCTKSISLFGTSHTSGGASAGNTAACAPSG
ncbi:MAG: zinc ribbon domain-containing protein [Chloroflexi bacterium]|nr:zinc ribbon domain-containing protein [Chloroflexota bacterium]